MGILSNPPNNKEQHIKKLLEVYGKGKAMRDNMETNNYNSIEVEALQSHIIDKSPAKKEVKAIIDKQTKDDVQAQSREAIRLGHARMTNDQNKQSQLDQIERQNRLNNYAKELLQHKYKYSSTRAFDKASENIKTNKKDFNKEK